MVGINHSESHSFTKAGVLHISLFVVITSLQFGLTRSVIQNVKHYRASYGKNTKASGLTKIGTIQTRSVIQCGDECHVHPDCDAFHRYSAPSSDCELLQGIPDPADISFQTGVTFYQRDLEYYCPTGFVKNDALGGCYGRFDSAATRGDALTTCTTHSATAALVGIRNQAERDFVLSLLPVPTPLASASNIALSAGGASCEANSWWDADYDCWKAIDGDENPATSEWTILEPPAVGTWIRVVLDQTYAVESVDLLTRCYGAYQNRDFRVDFSDGNSFNGRLDCFSGNDRTDCAATYWQSYVMTSNMTSYVHVEVVSVCTDGYNGLREMRVLGSPVTSYWTSGRSVGVTWYWDTEPMTYYRWANGAPPVNQTDTCLVVARSPDGLTSMDCDNTGQTLPFVCQSPILVR